MPLELALCTPAGQGFFPSSSPQHFLLWGAFFFPIVLFKAGQCNALLHRAAQEVICGHKWEAADTGLDGHGQIDGCYSPNLGDLGRHQSPLNTTRHFLVSKPAFNLEFAIYHQNHGKGRKHSKWYPDWGGGRRGEIFLNVASLQCFEGRISLDRCMCQESGFPH